MVLSCSGYAQERAADAGAKALEEIRARFSPRAKEQPGATTRDFSHARMNEIEVARGTFSSGRGL
jgi:hypothetical protein